MTPNDFLKLVAWDVLNPALLRLKRGRRYDLPAGTVGINLGCGIDSPEGWLGVDGGVTHAFVHAAPDAVARRLFKRFRMSKGYSYDDYAAKVKGMDIVHHDLLAGIPFADGSVPHVFTSHFIEHLFRPQAVEVFREARRVLRPGGVLRVTVPALEHKAERLRAALAEFDDGDPTALQPFVTSDRVGYYSPFSTHRWMYDFGEMERALQEAGFERVEERQRGEGEIPDVERLDTRRGLFVEATA